MFKKLIIILVIFIFLLPIQLTLLLFAEETHAKKNRLSASNENNEKELIENNKNDDGVDDKLPMIPKEINFLFKELMIFRGNLFKKFLKDKYRAKNIIGKYPAKSLLIPIEEENLEIKKGLQLPPLFHERSNYWKRGPELIFDLPSYNPVYEKYRDSDAWRAEYGGRVPGPIFKSKKEWFSFYKFNDALYYSLKDKQGEPMPALTFLVSRSKVLPPARIDELLGYAFIFNHPSFDRNSKTFNKEYKKYWNQMLVGKNPVYRLLALQNVLFFVPKSKLLTVYSNALKEKDNIFHETVFRLFLNVSIDDYKNNPKALEIFSRYLQKRQNDGTCLMGTDVVDTAKNIVSKLTKAQAKTEEKDNFDLNE